MRWMAALLALALAQSEGAPASTTPPVGGPPPSRPAAPASAPAERPAGDPRVPVEAPDERARAAEGAPARAEPPASRPAPGPDAAPARDTPSPARAPTAAGAAAPLAPPPPAASGASSPSAGASSRTGPATPPPTAPPEAPASGAASPSSAASPRTGPATAPPTAPAADPAASPRAPPAPERVQVAAAARRFLLAFLARRPAELASLCAPSFSFDGRTEKGADGVRARWAEVLGSDAAGEELLDLAVAPAAEAQARLGKPPKRIAPLLVPGSWVAVANVSGRPVAVVFARQGGAWLATGIHD